MVIKGKSVAGAKRLAVHLQRTDTNERMEVIELTGVAADDLTGALREMEAVASAAPNCKRPFYHASINTREDERLTPEQRDKAINRLEQELGLEGQPRIVVVHVKHGREHFHIGWLRIDLEKMRAISDSHNYRKHELVARELEREFGHARVQGAHIERDGQERPARTPSQKELRQAERTKIAPEAAREHLSALWRATDNGASFKAALEQSGWVLAQGDRRDFVAIDPKGGAHSVARRIDGATTQMVRDRFADLDRSKLPSVAACRETLHSRQLEKTAPVKDNPMRQATQAKQQTPATVAQARPAKPDRFAPRPARATVKAVSKTLDGIANAFEGLLGGAPSRPKDDATDATPATDKATRSVEARQETARQADESDRSARRAKYLQDFSREVPQSQERDAEIERGTKGRERTRGEYSPPGVRAPSATNDQPSQKKTEAWKPAFRSAARPMLRRYAPKPQPIRAEECQNQIHCNLDGEFAAELSAVGSYYASLIAAAMASLAPDDVRAMVRIILAERTLATRAVLDRWATSSKGFAEKKTPNTPIAVTEPRRPRGRRFG